MDASLEEINARHDALLAAGYVLVGFHGSLRADANSMLINGVDLRRLGLRVGAQNGQGFYAFLLRLRTRDFAEGYDPESERQFAALLKNGLFKVQDLQKEGRSSFPRFMVQSRDLSQALQSLGVDPSGNDEASLRVLTGLDLRLTSGQPGVLRVYLPQDKLGYLRVYSIDHRPIRPENLGDVELVIPLEYCSDLQFTPSPDGDELEPTPEFQKMMLLRLAEIEAWSSSSEHGSKERGGVPASFSLEEDPCDDLPADPLESRYFREASLEEMMGIDREQGMLELMSNVQRLYGQLSSKDPGEESSSMPAKLEDEDVDDSDSASIEALPGDDRGEADLEDEGEPQDEETLSALFPRRSF